MNAFASLNNRALWVALAAGIAFALPCRAADATDAPQAPQWSVLDGDALGLVYGPQNSSEVLLQAACARSTGEVQLLIPGNASAAPSVKQSRGLFTNSVGTQVRSGPVTRYYSLNVLGDESGLSSSFRGLYFTMQIDDAIWSEFYRSGRLAVASIDFRARTRSDMAVIKDFTELCRRKLPLVHLTSPELHSAITSSDGFLAYPFSAKTLGAICIGGLIASVMSASGGIRLGGLAIFGGVLASAAFSIGTAAQAAAPVNFSWPTNLNEIFVPIAEVFGQISAAWLVVGGAGFVLGIGVKEVSRKFKKQAVIRSTDV